MEQLPLTFIQATVEPDIQECFRPSFNFTKISSSSGRLAFTPGKVYWLPDNPMAMMDQGWVIGVSEIESYGKWGLAGFSIKLVDGKELRFSNVGGKMRDEISAAIEAHKGDPAPAAAPAAAAAPDPAGPEPAAAPVPPAAEEGPAAEDADAMDPADVSSNKVMAILAYFGILVLIPIFAAKDSKFARYHSNQGLILLICAVVAYAIGKVPHLGFLWWILDVVILVFAIIGIVHAAKGEAKPLPLIGKFRILS
ncbi:MAG: hypothetical protein IKP46_09445 [Bacteroidales bacterium]|nr:hypothetical protein [Bacteroidales bacterium]